MTEHGSMSPPSAPRSPARAEAAAGVRTLPDLIAPGLDMLFCGFHPTREALAAGRHFAEPGSHFWTALYYAGLTECVLTPVEDEGLLRRGLGLTYLLPRAVSSAAAVPAAALEEGWRI